MSDLISKSELLKKFSVDSNGNKIPEYDVDNFQVTLTISEVKEIIRKAQTTSDKKIRDKAIEEFVKEIKDWQDDIYDNERNPMVYDFVFDRIYEIAEQIKEVGE